MTNSTSRPRTVFAESDDVHRAPSVHAHLAREGTTVDRKTVATSMLRQGLEGISPKKFTPVTTIPGADLLHDLWPGHKRLGPGWTQAKCGFFDITYLRTGEGWLYLAAVTGA